MEFPPEESEKEDKYIDLLLEEKDKRIKEKNKRIKRLKGDSRKKEQISALKDQIDNLRQTLRQKQQQIESLKENQITPENIEEEIEDYIDLDAIEKLQKEKEKEIEHLKETDEENLDKIRELSRKNEELKKELKRKANNNENDPIIKKYRENHRTKKEEAALAVEDFFKNRDGKFKTPKIVEEIHGEKLKTSDSRYNRIREKLHKLVDEGKLEREVRKNTHFYTTTDSKEKAICEVYS